MQFLRTPASYYDEVPGRVGEIEESVADLQRLGILVDCDDEGYLLQIFTKPLGDRSRRAADRQRNPGLGEGRTAGEALPPAAVENPVAGDGAATGTSI